MTKRYISPLQIFDSWYSGLLKENDLRKRPINGRKSSRSTTTTPSVMMNNNNHKVVQFNSTRSNSVSSTTSCTLVPTIRDNYLNTSTTITTTTTTTTTNSDSQKRGFRRPRNNSFIAVYECFINSVSAMESTILVPTLLKDIQLNEGQWLPSIIAKGNCRQLFDIFCLMKRCKSDFSEVGFEDESGNFLLYQVKEDDGREDDDGDFAEEEEDEDDDGGGGVVGVGGEVIDHHHSSHNHHNNMKQKISLDSGNWSVASDSVMDEDFDCDSRDSDLLYMESLVPQLIRTTSANLRNLKTLFIHLKEVADFVTLKYLETLQLT